MKNKVDMGETTIKVTLENYECHRLSLKEIVTTINNSFVTKLVTVDEY